MTYKIKLLSSDDLKELYRVTGPEEKFLCTLYMMIRHEGGDWEIEFDHPLRGYKGTIGNLEQRTRQYSQKSLWPEKVSLGVGIYQDGKLVRVLEAKNLGGYHQ